jgi:uncharacterized membrane protein YhaH (DUF805 family)
MNGQNDWLELFTSSTGRLARTPFLVAAVLILVLAGLYEVITGDTLKVLTGWAVYPALLFFAANLLAKRLHDRGRSGWWTAIIILALIMVWPMPHRLFDGVGVLVVVWAVVELGMLPGEQGANRYGPNPSRAPQTA